jgi:DNA-binding beta-propeller fold protein YncE
MGQGGGDHCRRRRHRLGRVHGTCPSDQRGLLGFSVIDTTGNTVVASVDVTSGPLDVTISPDGAAAYALLFGQQAASVATIDLPTRTVTKTAAIGAADVSTITITPDGRRLLVPNGDEQLAVVATGS